MNFLKIFKKELSSKSVEKFLTKKFTPIAKYVYNNGTLIVVPIPIHSKKGIYFHVYILSEKEDILAKWEIEIQNLVKWMLEKK